MAGVTEDVFGVLAVHLGYCSQEAVDAARQAQGREGEARRALADVLIESGRLAVSDAVVVHSTVQTLVRHRVDRRLGRLAVAVGLVSEREVRAAIQEQRRILQTTGRQIRLGPLLQSRGALDLESRRQLMILQDRLGAVGPGVETWSLRLGNGGSLTVTDPDPMAPEDASVVRVELDGEVDGRAAEDLDMVLRHLVGLGRSWLVIDVSETVYLGSAAVGALVRLAGEIRDAGGDLRITGVGAATRRIFDILGEGMPGFVRYSDSVEEAMVSFRPAVSPV